MAEQHYYYQHQQRPPSQRPNHAQSSRAAAVQPTSQSRSDQLPPIDPALSAMYPSYYPQYDNRQQQRHHPVMHSSPSDASDSIASPNTDISNINGKRPAPAPTEDPKRIRKEDPLAQTSTIEKDLPSKPKSTRGSRYVHTLQAAFI